MSIIINSNSNNSSELLLVNEKNIIPNSSFEDINDKEDNKLVSIPTKEIPPSLGNDFISYLYHNKDGYVLLEKWRKKDKSAFGQRSYGQLDGKTAWHCKAIENYPPYDAHIIVQNPKAIIMIVEGEKLVETLKKNKLLSENIIATTSGGAYSAGSCDWSILRGREVIICPDKDQAGTNYATNLTNILLPKAATLKIISLPKELPEGCDVGDIFDNKKIDNNLSKEILKGRNTSEWIQSLIQEATIVNPDPILPNDYEMKIDGLYIKSSKDEKKSIKICQSFKIIGNTKDNENRNHGFMVSFYDQTNSFHQITIPRRKLAGDGTEICSCLMDQGFCIIPSKKKLFLDCLSAITIDKIITAIPRTGWYKNINDKGEAEFLFFTKNKKYGPNSSHYVLQNDLFFMNQPSEEISSLELWQQEIASYIENNSILTLAVAVSLTSPLLDIMSKKGGGFHLVGETSSGKTTALNIASSVWGKPDKIVKTWRGTGNGIEEIASQSNNIFLALDEFGEVKGSEAGSIIYMLANGQGKIRMKRNIEMRNIKKWKTIFLSSGEETLEDKIKNENRQPMKGGQEIRFLNINSDAGKNMGVLEECYNHMTPKQMVDHLNIACYKYYGSAGNVFLENLVDERNKDEASLIEKISQIIKTFFENYLSSTDSAAVVRAADQFGLVAAAGILAVEYGIIPLDKNDILMDIGKCFKAWVTDRGTDGSIEEKQLVDDFIVFLSTENNNYFQKIKLVIDRRELDKEQHLKAHYGFKEEDEFYLTYAGMRKIAKGNHNALIRACIKSRIIIPDTTSYQKNGKPQNQQRRSIPYEGGEKRERFYIVKIPCDQEERLGENIEYN